MSPENKSIYNIAMAGSIINHKRFCFKSNCNCDSLYDRYEPKTDCIRGNKSFSRINSSISNITDEFKYKKKLEMMTESKGTILANFINDELNVWLTNNTANAKIHILRAIVCDEMLNQKCKALYELMKAEETIPSIALQFQMFFMKIKIKKDMAQDDMKKESNTKNSISKVIKYHEMLIESQEFIIEAISRYEEFWEEIKLPNPLFTKILSFICEISSYNEKIKYGISAIQALTNNDIKATVLYSLYLKMVEEDYFAANEQHLKFKTQSSLGKNVYDESESKYGPASYIGVIMISGNKSDIGKITNCNQEVEDILGYKKDELTGNNISIVMPSSIGQSHNSMIEAFYNKNAQQMRLAYVEKLELALHKIGYLVPVNVIFRMNQSFLKGIAFTGFVGKSKILGDFRIGDENIAVSEAYLFLLSPDNYLLGFNKEFAQIFTLSFDDINIKKYLTRDKKIDMTSFFPQILKTENDSMLTGSLGMEVETDLNSLKDALEVIIKENVQSPSKEGVVSEETKQQIQWEKTSKDMIKNQFIFKMYKAKKQIEFNVLTLVSSGHRSTFIENKQMPDEQESVIKSKKDKCDDDYQIEENQSVSATTSSVSQTEIERRIIKDFKFTLRDKRLSRTIKVMMNISVILFILLSVLQTVSLNIEVKKFTQLSDTFELVNMVFNRYTNVVAVVMQMRVASNIISGTESSTTSITTDGDRLGRYINLLQVASDTLKSLETKLPNNAQWDLIKDISERKDMEITDFTYDANGSIYNYSRVMTLQAVMQTYIIKSAIFEEYSMSFTPSELDAFMKKLDLYFKFINTNGLTSLLHRLQISCDLLFQGVLSSYSKEQMYLQILNVCIGVIGMISLCTLIPILSKMNNSIKKILKFFSSFSKDDYTKVLERLGKFREVINLHFREIKRFFVSINFQDDISKREQNQSNTKESSVALSNEQNRKLTALTVQRHLYN